MKRLFLDMDGTLARFYEIDQYMEKMFEENFFRNLDPYTRVIKGIYKLQEKHPDIEIFVLSACISERSKIEKAEWLEEYFPIDKAHQIFVMVGESKADFVPGGVSKDDYLVDDYNKNLHEWTEAGGVGIKIKNEINCQNGTWRGARVSTFDDPDDTVANIEAILEL